MTSLNIPSGKESEDLPYLYWIPKLHKTPYKERYIDIVGSLVHRNDNIFVMKTGKTLNSFLFTIFKVCWIAFTLDTYKGTNERIYTFVN
jgi:hypothetical protein